MVMEPLNALAHAATRWFDNVSREFRTLILSLSRLVSNNIRPVDVVRCLPTGSDLQTREGPLYIGSQYIASIHIYLTSKETRMIFLRPSLFLEIAVSRVSR